MSSTTADKIFVDTNVLVYAHNLDAGVKHATARKLIADLWMAGAGVLSLQVLQELYVTVTRKIPAPLDATAAREILRTYAAWLTVTTELADVLRASELEKLHRISFWDALIITCASKAGAKTLATEDMNAGQVIAGVRIENPFRVTQ